MTYKLSEIKDKEYMVQCDTREEWDRVTKVLGHEWGDDWWSYEKGRTQWINIDYLRRSTVEPYNTVISAEDFLRDNQDQDIPQPGDWMVITLKGHSDDNQILKVKGPFPNVPRCWELEGTRNGYSYPRQMRRARPEEIPGYRKYTVDNIIGLKITKGSPRVYVIEEISIDTCGLNWCERIGTREIYTKQESVTNLNKGFWQIVEESGSDNTPTEWNEGNIIGVQFTNASSVRDEGEYIIFTIKSNNTYSNIEVQWTNNEGNRCSTTYTRQTVIEALTSGRWEVVSVNKQVNSIKNDKVKLQGKNHPGSEIQGCAISRASKQSSRVAAAGRLIGNPASERVGLSKTGRAQISYSAVSKGSY